MPRNKESSQIATILTLIMAAIFLFIVITINIGNIAQEKTMVSNASDGAALLLASMLGSLANALKINLELWGDRVKNCEVDWLLLTSILVLIASIALAIGTLGAGTPAVVAALAWTGVAISAALFGLGMYNALVGEPGVFKQFELKFQNMTLEQRMKEKAIQYALFAVVTDPNKICQSGKLGGGDPKDPACGGCSDPYDLDMDGDTTDCIHWFSKWYNDRLLALPRVGDIVETLYRTIFDRNYGGGRAPRFYVWEDPETWKPYKEPKPSEFIHQGFWINTDNDVPPRPDPEQGDLRLAIYSNDTHDRRGIIYAHDIYFTDWLEQRLIPLTQELYRYGYGLYRNKDVNTAVKEIKDLLTVIKDFQKELGQIYGTTFDSRVESFEEWIVFFYDPNKNDEWFDRMQDWINQVNFWIGRLEYLTSEINNDLDLCRARGPWACGYGGGNCCECHWEDCNPHECGCDEYGRNCDTCWDRCPVCESECGCGPGAGGGKFCPSSSPCGKPTHTPTTSAGVRVNCCNGAYNLHYQLCDASRYCTGRNADCGASQCCDTYHNCGVDHNLNRITWEHAVNYLQQFLDDVTTIRNAFETAYNQYQARKGDPKAYEALYEWDDKVAKGQAGEQVVHHIVYVHLDKNSFKSYTTTPLDERDDVYAIPHVHTKRRGLIVKCTQVASSKGSFNITVARYDQDIGARSPLRNLWIFKTRGKALEGAPIGPGSYTAADAAPSSYATKADFVLKNGIVSQTEGHYGPGWTYKKEELESWGTRAKLRNKDIYIKRLK